MRKLVCYVTLREGRSSRISEEGTSRKNTWVKLREIFIFRGLIILTVPPILFKAIKRSVRKGQWGT